MKKSFYGKINVKPALILAAALLDTSVASAQSSGVASKLTAFQSYLNPIINIIFGIACLFFAIRLFIAFMGKSPDVGSRAAYFIGGLVFWLIKSLIISDISSI